MKNRIAGVLLLVLALPGLARENDTRRPDLYRSHPESGKHREGDYAPEGPPPGMTAARGAGQVHYPSEEPMVREIHRAREGELALMEQMADQMATMSMEQGRLQDEFSSLRQELEISKRAAHGPGGSYAGALEPTPHGPPEWFERFSFQMPIVAAALGVFASGIFLQEL